MKPKKLYYSDYRSFGHTVFNSFMLDDRVSEAWIPFCIVVGLLFGWIIK